MNKYLAHAVALHHAGRLEDAAVAYARVLETETSSADAYHFAGMAAFALNNVEQAAEYFGRAAELDPDNHVIQTNFGSALQKLERFEDGVRVLSHALTLNPDSLETHVLLGYCLLGLGRLLEAEATFSKAARLNPKSIDVLEGRALALNALLRYDEALQYLREVLAIEPTRVAAHRFAGDILQRQYRYDEALVSYRQSLAFNEDNAASHNNIGLVLTKQGQIEDAVAYHRRAVALRPEDPTLVYNLALPLLMLGHFDEGWMLYDARNQAGSRALADRPHVAPWLDGRDIAGKRLLAWTDQGVGEAVMFASLVPDVIAAGAQLTIECEARLVPLFARSFPDVKVIPYENPPHPRFHGSFDARIGLPDLAHWFRPNFASFPHHAGYLKADEAQSQMLRRRYLQHDGTHSRLVGISWQTRAGAKFSPLKTLELIRWARILQTPGVTFVNLQYGDSAAEVRGVEEALGIKIVSDPEINAAMDLDGFAAQVKAMDLVITTSNTTAHVAGALNVPTWTFVPLGYGGIWHWFLDRDDSPWYPAMRLFRQLRVGDWDDPLDRVATLLGERFRSDG